MVGSSSHETAFWLNVSRDTPRQPILTLSAKSWAAIEGNALQLLIHRHQVIYE
jgi:hypothetical protein